MPQTEEDDLDDEMEESNRMNELSGGPKQINTEESSKKKRKKMM